MARNKINQISYTDDENNSLVTENSRTQRSRSLRRTENNDRGSICWKYFEPKVPKEGKVTKCTINGCNAEYIWYGSTTNLLRHLRIKHSIPSTKDIQPSLTNNNFKAVEVLPAIKFIVSSVSPFSIVDHLKSSGLVDQPIAPSIIKEQIDKIEDRLFSQLKPKIQQAESVMLSVREFNHKRFLIITYERLTEDFEFRKILLYVHELQSTLKRFLGYYLDKLDVWELTNLKFISLNLNYDFLYYLDFHARENIIICMSGGNSDDLIRYSLKRWASHDQKISNITTAIMNVIDKYHSIVEFLGDNRVQSIMQSAKKMNCTCNYHKIEFLTLIIPFKQLINHYSNNDDDFIRENINQFKALLLDQLPFSIFPKLLQLFKPLEHIKVVTMRNLRDMLFNAFNMLNEILLSMRFTAFLIEVSEYDILKSFLTFLIYSYLNLHQRVGLFLDPYSKSIFIKDQEVRKLVLDECQDYYSEIANSSGINSTKIMEGLAKEEIEYYISRSQLTYNENDDLCKWWKISKNTYPGLATLAIKYLPLLKLDDEVPLENLNEFINAYQNNEILLRVDVAVIQYTITKHVNMYHVFSSKGSFVIQ
ncbi:20801_t:CDS:2 [Gigaspora margarita]|uniref:20801_t:CDS:1 n=1 Tax=Gigaspora margarita TaxID=4874 RepID=A0ABN7ULE3_GIGMA|nr:20801_t:CDS:2 [Gigaspora margarita]